MVWTDHELFVIQAAAGVAALIPTFFYVVRPIYRGIKKIVCSFFHRVFIDGLTDLIKTVVLETIHPYIKELVPNGGSSLNDTIKLKILPAVEEMKTELKKQGQQVAKLEGRFEQYTDDVVALK